MPLLKRGLEMLKSPEQQSILVADMGIKGGLTSPLHIVSSETTSSYMKTRIQGDVE